jgi:hypothetical protein
VEMCYLKSSSTCRFCPPHLNANRWEIKEPKKRPTTPPQKTLVIIDYRMRKLPSPTTTHFIACIILQTRSRKRERERERGTKRSVCGQNEQRNAQSTTVKRLCCEGGKLSGTPKDTDTTVLFVLF